MPAGPRRSRTTPTGRRRRCSPPSRQRPGAAPAQPAAAAQAERDAVAAVALARLALTDAALAVLQARLARIDAGEDDPDAAVVDGHVPLHGRNPVSRHGPALAHGVTGEIHYILTRKPRSTVKSLAIALAMGLLYLGLIRLFEWDKDKKWLPYLGLWAIGVVMGGSVCVNAMSFDAMRVRAALDSGARLWQLLVIKNLALLCIVAPIGFLLCALLAWRAGDIYAFYKACALMVCMILLWLGVGNVLSVALPSRDEPIRKRKQSGSLKQFIIAFVVSYLIGYLVNGMLVWRIFAAENLANRLGSALSRPIIIIVSSAFMWILLTVLAAALAQQPKVRRVMQKEIADYNGNAEAQAFAREEAAAKAAPVSRRNRPAPSVPDRIPAAQVGCQRAQPPISWPDGVACTDRAPKTFPRYRHPAQSRTRRAGLRALPGSNCRMSGAAEARQR